MAVTAGIVVAACDPGTRIEGQIFLDEGLAAPDDERHTLYVAAFGSSAVMGGVFDTAATPLWVEFSGIKNDDFDPSVAYALGGAGSAAESRVFAWWKVDAPTQPDYEPVESGDLFGRFPGTVFEGQNGTGRGGSAKDVDIVLDTVFVSGSSTVLTSP